MAEDVVRTPRECDIWKRKQKCLSLLDPRGGRLERGLAGLTNYPGSFAKKGLMLRLSIDGRNWNDVGNLTPSN